MAIPASYRTNFATLVRACKADDLALVECKDAATGEPRYVVCAIALQDGEYEMTPFGHLCRGDPYDDYIDPSSSMPMDREGE